MTVLDKETEKAYRAYERRFKELKGQGIIKEGTRKFQRKRFAEFVKDQREEQGLDAREASKQLLQAQNKFGGFTSRELEAAYKKYKKEGSTIDAATWGEQGRQDAVDLGVRTFKQFKREVSIHQIIALRMNTSRKSRAEILEEYGY